MIKVKYKSKGFNVSGHALFANPGDDIVCSAVSVTTIGIINEIERYVGKNKISLTTDQKEGIIDFNVDDDSLEVEILLKYFQNTMNDLEKNYQKYIKIYN